MAKGKSASSSKRKPEAIDLTGSDDDDGKRQRQNRSSWRRPDANESLSQRSPSSRNPPNTSRNQSLGAIQAERDAWLAPNASQQSNLDDSDIYESISSTQNYSSNSDSWMRYGHLAGKIVGVRYYDGFATYGEKVLLLREPGNPYDSNAIRVENMIGKQIGHIPRMVAAKLARYMDLGQLIVEASIAGEIGQFDCLISINLFGPPLNSPESGGIRSRMKADRLPLQAIDQLEANQKKQLIEERQRAAKGAKQPPSEGQPEWAPLQIPGNGPPQEQTMNDIISTSEHFNPRDVGRAAERFGNSEDALANLPAADQPERIATKMLPYQLQALAWMEEKESPSLPAAGSQDYVQLWRRHDKVKGAFTNIATSFSVKGEPELASGGILADDMGLGKTLEMIALIVDGDKKVAKGSHHATLIIAPLSVMSNWSDQIARHMNKKDPLKVYTYHGNEKLQNLDAFDVVITTYQTLAREYLPDKTDKAKPVPRSSGLYAKQWRRIILDEAHIIRNPQSKGAAAACAVLAKSRWCLTGTPIINSLKDLYSLVRFIGLTGGLEKIEVFNSVLIRPLKAGDGAATALLQAIMSSLCLRRKKEMKFVDLRLPTLHEYVHRISFYEKEQERYDALYRQAKGTLQDYRAAEGREASDAFSHLLEVLLRLRQVCNHWQLCAERVDKLMETLQGQKTVELTPENCKALQQMLQLSIESQEDCPICLETLHNPVITHCAHAFGRECIQRVIDSQHKCPMCRAELKSEGDLVEPVHEYGDEGKDEDLDVTASSTKLEALISILKASKKGSKTVVFSQWTRFLDIVQARLDKEGIKYCRIDGTMNATDRDRSLHALEDDDSCTVMLASLGVCAVGLNLVAANQVVLSDSWWAPAIEDQAVDRVHRLGQKRETSVFRLVVDGSIEDRTLEIQAEKRKLMTMAFQEKSNNRGGGRTARLGDIEKLLK